MTIESTTASPPSKTTASRLTGRFWVVAALASSLAVGTFAIPEAPAQAVGAPVVVDGMNLDRGGAAVINKLERTEVAPGLVHVKFDRLDAVGWQQINVLKAELSDDTVKMKYLNPETIAGPGGTVTEMVERQNAIAGVNLDRFDINNSWAAAGWGIRDGEILKSASVGANASVGMTADGLGALVDLVLEGSVTFADDSALTIASINTNSFDYQHVALYNSLWGTYSRAAGLLANPGIEVWIGADGRVEKAAQPVGDGAIPEGVQVLVALAGSATATKLESLAVGDTADIQYGVQDDSLDIQEAGGAWHRLLSDGAAFNNGNADHFTSVHPRTMIGFSQDRKTAYFVVTDGRTVTARGMNFTEMSALMQDLGAHDAISADGGGSSQMNIRHAGESSTTVKNIPSDLVERRDGDGMGLVLAQPGSGRLTGFAVQTASTAEGADRVFPGLHRTLTSLAHDEKNSPVAESPARWSSNSSATATVADGVVAGKKPGTTTITAASGVARGQKKIEVLGELKHLSADQSVINLEAQGSSALINVTGHDVEGFTAPVEPQDIEVVNPNPDTFSVEPTADGRFNVTAIGETGSAILEFTHGEIVTRVTVAVPLEVRVIDDYSDVSGWGTAHDRAPTGGLELGEGHDGHNSLRLNYDFTESTGTRGRYAVAPGAPGNVPAGTEATGGIAIPGQPQKLSVWIKGDGKGSLLRLQVRQGNGVVNWIDGPDGVQSLKTTWTGWERKDFIVPSTFVFPLKLERIRVLETVASKQYTGSLEFSQILAYLPPDGTETPKNEPVEDPIITEADATDDAKLRVAVVSDAQFVGRAPDSAAERGGRKALREAVAEDPDVLIINGDFVDESNDIDFDRAELVLEEELGDADFPWYYVPGNHEVMGQPISNFKKYFGDNRHAFTLKNTRFITVDSSSLKHSGDFSQIKLIREELDAAAKDPNLSGVLLISHVPTNDPLPAKSSQISDRQEAELLDDWVQEFRAESGKSIAFVNGHVGVFHTTRVNGVPYVINGNSGKSPSSTPDNGGFTGWTALGIDPDAGYWNESDDDEQWLGVEVKPRVTDLTVAAPAEALGAGESFALAPVIRQVETGANESDTERSVPVAWPISYTWSGSEKLHVGAADDAPESAIAALDPETSELTALRAGSGEATLLVNGETKTVPFSVVGGELQVTGTPVFGQTLRAELGSWASGASVAYQWQRDGEPIDGATASSYRLGADDLGATVSVEATVSAEGRSDVTVHGAASGAVALATMSAPAATIAGDAVLGSVLAADAGSWPEGTRLVFQWLRGGTEIPGAVSSGYSPVEADLGATLRVRVTGHLEGYAPASVLSAESAAVTETDGGAGGEIPGTVKTGTASVAGTAAVGKTLALRTSGWESGVVFATQWYRDGVAIPGADGTRYRLTSADLRARISATVIASKTGLVSVRAESRTTGAVKPGTLRKLNRPEITGKAKVGSTVRVKRGKVDSGARVKTTWLRGSKVLKTGSSYRVRSSDAKKRIRVKVTVTKPGYATQTKVSAPKRVRTR